MNIKYGKQVEMDELSGLHIDLFICAGNHENRVFTAIQKIKAVNEVCKSIVLCYKDGFSVKQLSGSVERHVITDHHEIYNLLNKELSTKNKSELTLFVDYSCMTKSWYYSIILFLTRRNLKFNNIDVYFSYTPSKFSKPLKPKHNSEIAPLPGKYIVPTDKPKALIVCLGYEQNKAEGIIDHLDPKIAYVFYTKPTLDAHFVRTLESNNKNILEERKQTVITYKFDDLLELERKLTATYLLLKNDFSVIIAPLGPKPFTFISMMMSVKYHDIDIWRVGSGSDINEYKRDPIDGKFIVSKVALCNA